MSPQRKAATVYLSNVPSVTKLCERLGFTRASRETGQFTEASHTFRKGYLCTNGRPGIELTDWNAPIIQQELTAMADAFLDDGDNGDRFWSEWRPWKEDGDILFPEDRKHIADLLKQLFWKQNKHALNNQLSSERKNGRSSEQSREEITSGQESVAVPSRPPFGFSQQTSSWSAEPPLTNIHSKGTAGFLQGDGNNKSVRHVEEFQGYVEEIPDDIFEFNGEDVSNTNENPPESGKTTRHGRKRGISSGTTEDRHFQAVKKRQSNSHPSAKIQKAKPKNKRVYRKKKTNTLPKRSSGRHRIVREIPGAVPDEVLETILGTDDERDAAVDQQGQHKTSLRSKRYRIASDSDGDFHGIAQKTPKIPATFLTSDVPARRDDAVFSLAADPNLAFAVPAVPTRANMAENSSSRQLRTPRMSPAMSETTLYNAISPTIDQSSGLKSKSKVRGRIFIVTSPEPNYEMELWENGQIKDKSLSTVIEEISHFTQRGGIEKLRIKLKTSIAKMTETVHKDSEEWEFTKITIDDMIREAFVRDRTQLIHFKIWIEPLYSDVVMDDDAGLAEEEYIKW